MASLGSKDHRLIGPRELEYRLSTQLAGWKHNDPPPARVKPVPLNIVRHTTELARTTNDAFDLAIADMSTVGWYYLCRPGEHTSSSEDARSVPFRLCDVVFYQGSRRLPSTAAFVELHTASFCLLTYSEQKNAVKGETIGHGRTRDPYLGPVKALARRVEHLRRHNCPPETPLHTVLVGSRVRHVRSSDITAALRRSAAVLLPLTGIHPQEISARGLRSGGAMGLLCARIDSDIIRLVGRWRSDEMFRYLHAQAYPLMHTFAQQMTLHGNFSLAPGQDVPATIQPLLNQVPV